MIDLKDPVEKKKLTHINATIILILFVFPLAGYFYDGVDFAKATLLGCLIVTVNFFISEFVVAKIIVENKAGLGLLVIYLIKISLTVLVLYLALKIWKLDVIGLVLGLTSVVLSTLVSSVIKKQSSDQGV
ncbi:MAG: ATP synthase subunit I [Deltaproteobacteria bacterium]|nr:ATP synthase subunit I [Deltaproteobacteria bacterium]